MFKHAVPACVVALVCLIGPVDGAAAPSAAAASTPANVPAKGSGTPATALAPAVRTLLPNACKPMSGTLQTSAQEIVTAIARDTAKLPQVRVASRQQFIPDAGAVDLLVYKKSPDNGEARINYRVVVIDADAATALSSAVHDAAANDKDAAATPLRAQWDKFFTRTAPAYYQSVPPALVWAERATGGASGTDFQEKESSEDKTLLRFDTDIVFNKFRPWWSGARVFVVGCDDKGTAMPLFVGSFETGISTTWMCNLLSILACLAFYSAGVAATFNVRRSSRAVAKGSGTAPLGGTNYASIWAHFNPVVLTAAGNGRGSATKLQIMFFSVLVFGVVAHIWMRTGHLTGLSNNVLLLMGISGLGATAAAGAELSKNRLSFDNWAWLINRGWLPQGGGAEVHRAQWKDIVTTDGEFDVYRFQMITFTVLVGVSLLLNGMHQSDLSTFDIPTAFLGILGLSQAVYVMGKLVAPPAVSDLNDRIDGLQNDEKALRDTIDKATPSFLPAIDVLFTEDDSTKAARVAYNDYVEAWSQTLIMFGATLGREVPEDAKMRRPPWPVPNVLLDATRLHPAEAGKPYAHDLLAYGGTGAYTWSLEKGQLPPGMTLAPTGRLAGTPTAKACFTFIVRVTDSSTPPVSKLRSFVLQVV